MIRFSVIFIILFLLLSCKNKTVDNDEQNNTIIQKIDKSDEVNKIDDGIDFLTMKEMVLNSKKIDVDIFFAISVLHKKYISDFVEETKDMTEEEQKSFFQEKKNDFFNSIPYSENQYNDFLYNNQKAMNDYINHHPNIAKYLTTIN